ncbi:MAG: hypothetical protein ABIH23_17980, partial [bacterium]
QLLGITLEGPNADWFAHNGANQVIAPGAQFQFQVACTPQQEGPFQATVRIKSTDPNQPEVTIQLTGTGLAVTQPTPTPVVVPPSPTPTPVPTIPVGVLQPIIAYEFDQADLASDGWNEIPGGFTEAAAGQVTPLSFIGSLIPSSKDSIGLKITVDPSEVAFIHALNAVDVGDGPVVVRLRVRANGPDAEVALAMLKGSLVTGEAMDGSIATYIPGTATSLVQEERQMVLVYELDGPGRVTPIIQVAATGQAGPVDVYVDRLEIFDLASVASYVGSMFGPQPADAPMPAPGAAPSADMGYEFDQADLAANGWNEISGGFTGAPPGQISALSFVGSMIPSSQDKVGLRITANAGQVAFIHALQPVATEGLPLILRMTVRANAPGAAVALAALKGSLVTGEAMDGSIATHIPATAASFIDGERRIVLVYQPDSPDPVTPIIQVAAAAETGTVNIYVDKLEAFRISPTQAYPGSLFSSNLE